MTAYDPARAVAAALTKATQILTTAGLDSPRRDARLLLAEAMGVDHGAMLGAGAHVPAAAAHRFDGFIARRALREPVSRILGRREFWSLQFRLGAAVFDPRPESEAIVEAAVDEFKGHAAPRRILDLGTGSGCLLCALLTEFPDAFGIGVDVAPAAAAAARANAIALRLGERAAFAAADWGASLGGAFDLVVANPPYISEAELAVLAPEVSAFEPLLALSGGADGFDSIRAVAQALPRLLTGGGLAFVEIGAGQARAAESVFLRHGLRSRNARRDLAGIERVLVLAGFSQ